MEQHIALSPTGTPSAVQCLPGWLIVAKHDRAFAGPLERLMVWRVSKIDSTANVAAAAVLKAFDSARRSGRPSVECYRAGVEAWRRQHPDQTAEYTAKQAVAVILAAHAKIRIEE